MQAKSVELGVCCARELEKVLHQILFPYFHEHTFYTDVDERNSIPIYTVEINCLN